MLKPYLFFLLFMLIGVTACQTTMGKTSWQHYDECAKIHASFKDMASCGKESRNADCQKDNQCSGRGNALVQYVDSLVVSVEAGELSEAKARREWIRYRTEEENAFIADMNSQRSQRASTPYIPPQPRQTSCSTIGGSTFCNSF